MTTLQSIRTSFITHTGGRESIKDVVIVDFNEKYNYVFGRTDRVSKENTLRINVADAEEGAFIKSVVSGFVENLIDNNIGIPVNFNWDDAYVKYEAEQDAKQATHDAKYALTQEVNDAENNVTLVTAS